MTIMPAQFFADVRALSEPERRLRLAVLEGALLDCQQYPFGRFWRGRTVYQAAIDWLASEDRTEPFSFENVCEALSLDPDAVRSRLRRCHTAQLAASLNRRPAAPRSPSRPIGHVPIVSIERGYEYDARHGLRDTAAVLQG